MASHIWINTAVSFVALAFSYVAVTRDKARIKVVVNWNWKFNDSEEKLVIICATNIGRRNVVFSIPSLLRPDGENCSPQNSVGYVTLKEGEVADYFMNQEEIEKWMARYPLSEVQGLVIDSTGRRWYSKSDQIGQNIKFLWYRLVRKIKAHSFSNI